MPTRKHSIFLFRLFGVGVFLHYSWFFIAALQIYFGVRDGRTFSGHPHTVAYQILLYLALFLIVLIHEFGHSLACKSVKGTSDTIVLFPFGGVSYAQPPDRPGATLWTVVAGPLVNVILLPVTLIPLILLHVSQLYTHGTVSVGGDLLFDIACLNITLLVFNVLPVYPLDGGQIFRSLLWFVFGRAKSLVIASSIGLVCSILGGLAALLTSGLWLAAIAAFLALQAYVALQSGLALLRLEHLPRRLSVSCPYCRENPPVAAAWRCKCGVPFDMLEHRGHCPNCATQFPSIPCPWCGESAPMALWEGTTRMPITPPAVHGITPLSPVTHKPL